MYIAQSTKLPSEQNRVSGNRVQRESLISPPENISSPIEQDIRRLRDQLEMTQDPELRGFCVMALHALERELVKEQQGDVHGDPYDCDSDDYDSSMMGMSSDMVEELAAQGVRPWDDDAMAVLGCLYVIQLN